MQDKEGMGLPKKIAWIVGLCVPIITGMVFIGWCWYRQTVPAGLKDGEKTPYLHGSYDRGEFATPDGSHVLLVRSNDPGAMRKRDDFCFTWVVEDRGFWGKRVVASGYLPFTYLPPAKDQVPLRWIDNDCFTINFVADPVTGTPGGKVTVHLK